MKKTHCILRCIIFSVLLCLCIFSLQSMFCIKDYSIYSREIGFKQEKRNSLDAVYIGASHVFSFFEPPLAWEDSGIAVFNYAIPSMDYRSLKYRVIEAQKTQPDALIIINVNCYRKSATSANMFHRNLDYLPWSLNKVKLLRTLTSTGRMGLSDSLEYYLPIIRFHSGWPDLTSRDFIHTVNGYKGAYSYGPFLNNHTDVSGKKAEPSDEEFKEEKKEMLNDLLDYLEENDIETLFVTVPQILEPSELAQLEGAEKIIRDRGFNCLDLMGREDEFDVIAETDFDDEHHLNIHGAIKYTDYLRNYLIEHYGFENKKGKPGWESWERSVELYANVINPHCLPLEREHAARDYSIPAPLIKNVVQKDDTILLTWEKSEGAEGYEIYRKSDADGDNWWNRIADTDSSTEEYTDHEVTNETYTYTVVPYRSDGGNVYYGNFNYNGTSVTMEGEEES